MTPKIIAQEATENDKAEVMQKVLDYQWDRCGGVIEALASINPILNAWYGEGVNVPQSTLNRVAEEVFKLDQPT